MTVIAWDGKILAADKWSCNSGLIRTVTKIHRVGGAIVAVAGNLDQGLLMIEWVRQGCNPETFPKSQSGDNWATLVVADKDGLRHYEQTPYPIIVEDQIWAAGSGRDFALAAMHLGKDATEAVEVACVFQSDCGNGCDWFEIGPDGKSSSFIF
jgi:20S proteasome alpha/beta subunit